MSLIMMTTRIGAISSAVGAVLLGSTVADAQLARSYVLAEFADTPEGLAKDESGMLFTSLVHTGEIYSIAPDGSTRLVAVVPHTESGQGEIFGLDFDDAGNLYVAYVQTSIYGTPGNTLGD